MGFNSIKIRIVTCLAAWVVIMWLSHTVMGVMGIVPYTRHYIFIETTAAIIPLFFFANYLYIHIIRPLIKLSGEVKNLVHGIQPEPLVVSTNDEIGLMVKEFNTMIHAIHQRDILLKGLNERLQARNSELTAINERLIDADKVKTQFLASVTHELKTPLSTIRGYSDMMLEGVGGEINATQRHFVEDISASTLHLLQMVNDVLDFSKAAPGTMDLRFERFEIPEIVNDAEKELYPLLKEKRHSFEASFVPDLSHAVADRLRIKQVLLNLLSNAIKFTPEGGRVFVGSFKGEGHWGMVVKDNGIGIKEEDFSKVFQPLSQVDSSYSRRFEGTGLGLAICKRIVGMHGGQMWVESELGNGSSFYFTIPDNLQAGLKLGEID